MKNSTLILACIAFAVSTSLVAGQTDPSPPRMLVADDGAELVNYPIADRPPSGGKNAPAQPPSKAPVDDTDKLSKPVPVNDNSKPVPVDNMPKPVPVKDTDKLSKPVVPPTTGRKLRNTPPVRLGLSRDFAILAKTGISTVPSSVITGHVGVSPIAATALTGFSLVVDSSNTYSTSPQVTGRAYAADYDSPTSSMLTSAILDMQAAYNDAASRPITHTTNLDIKAGLISGSTFEPGVFKWGSDINFASDIYLRGNKDSRYIFQSTGNVIVGAGAKVILVPDGSGSAPRPANIVWQVAGYLDAGTSSHLEGVFLTKTQAVFKTGSSLNGRVLTQTACTLDSATITQP
jgi:hypothetical protein